MNWWRGLSFLFLGLALGNTVLFIIKGFVDSAPVVADVAMFLICEMKATELERKK